jgi:signal transduction histidine kinase
LATNSRVRRTLIEAIQMDNTAKVTCAESVKQVGNDPRDIVACVLHELRTPITAILCAGENICDGLLEDKDSLREEGTIIVAQAMRLMTAVEVIDNAVNSAVIFLQQGAFTVEREVHPGLSALRGGLLPLLQCRQNLMRMQ